MGSELSTDNASTDFPMSTPAPPPPPPVSTAQTPSVTIKVAQKKQNSAPAPPPPPPSAPAPPTAPSVKPPTVTTLGLSLEEVLKKRKEVKKARELPHPVPSNYQALGLTKKLRVVVWSDTHNHHAKKDIPAGDVLLHCGDMSTMGRLPELQAFNSFIGTLPHKHKIVICGNHEEQIANKTPEEIQAIFSNAIYLHDSSVTIEGIKLYGTPYVMNMSYYEPWMKTFYDDRYFYRSDETLAKIWEKIPEDTDILLTHMPPSKILDGDVHGSPSLAKRLPLLKNLKLHCFGHVHPMYGFQEKNGIMFINAAVDDEEHPFVFDYYYQ